MDLSTKRQHVFICFHISSKSAEDVTGFRITETKLKSVEFKGGAINQCLETINVLADVLLKGICPEITSIVILSDAINKRQPGVPEKKEYSAKLCNVSMKILIPSICNIFKTKI